MLQTSSVSSDVEIIFLDPIILTDLNFHNNKQFSNFLLTTTEADPKYGTQNSGLNKAIQ